MNNYKHKATIFHADGRKEIQLTSEDEKVSINQFKEYTGNGYNITTIIYTNNS